MIIGIDASRAFLKQRTGIEEYSYQLIKSLTDKINDHQVILFVRGNQKTRIDFELPVNWKIKVINLPRFWTQIGLSLELFIHPVDALLVPAHTVPCIHPQNTTVVIHGLEYEIMPEAYSFWERMYMRSTIKKSCQWAAKIVAVSKNTKADLMNLYKIAEDKISVIYEGVNLDQESAVIKNHDNSGIKIDGPYLLFIGRLEKRKNIDGMISAFEILKKKHAMQHKLVLAGKLGHGFENTNYLLSSLQSRDDIILTGFVSEKDKWALLRNADVFLFPTFYEGFGLPILEAQSFGIPVLASNVSSIPEVAGDGAAYCDPAEPISIADSVYEIINNRGFRDDIIKKGHQNVKRFSWDRCASEVAKILQ